MYYVVSMVIIQWRWFMKGTVLSAGLLSCIIAVTTFAAEKPEKASAQTNLDLYASPAEA
ncbi:hypothetical protein [uncultured Amphritea sp.]|uniref:hypothetical protein n=1 Tax=uncultured Amphritea sp. TaxID=981605 RepID=UPI0025D8F00A|nr:hypothetical protein [uncultured Amphritea sp.]